MYNLSDESISDRNTCCIMNLFYICVEFSSACVTFGKFSEQTQYRMCVSEPEGPCLNAYCDSSMHYINKPVKEKEPCTY